MAGDEPTNDARDDLGAPWWRRGWGIAAIVSSIVAALAVAGLGLLLITSEAPTKPSGEVHACVPTRDFTKDAAKDPDRVTCPPADAPYVDALLTEDDGDSILLQPLDGKQIRYRVREADRPYYDVAHAMTHAALGQPVRVFTKRVDGEDVVIYIVDSPLIAVQGGVTEGGGREDAPTAHPAAEPELEPEPVPESEPVPEPEPATDGATP